MENKFRVLVMLEKYTTNDKQWILRYFKDNQDIRDFYDLVMNPSLGKMESVCNEIAVAFCLRPIGSSGSGGYGYHILEMTKYEYENPKGNEYIDAYQYEMEDNPVGSKYDYIHPITKELIIHEKIKN